MTKTKVLLVEEAANIEVALQNRLEAMDFEVVAMVASPKLALEFLTNNKVDVVLMDLFLSSKISGNNAATEIYEKYNISVILLNSIKKAKLQQLKTSSAKLLMHKPLNDTELEFNINALSKKDFTANSIIPKETKKYIFVKADYKLNKIRLNDIFYIEASKDYVTINTTDNTYTVHSTMKDMEQALPTDMFIRTHRSFIVNIDKIFSIKYPEILIEKKMKTVQIGGLYRKRLFEKIEVV